MSEEQHVSDTAKKSIHAKVEHIVQRHLNSASPIYWTEVDCAKAIRLNLFALAFVFTAAVALFFLPYRSAVGAVMMGAPITQIVITSMIWLRVRRGEKIAKEQLVLVSLKPRTAKTYSLLFAGCTVIFAGFSMAGLVPVLLAPHGMASFLSAVYLLALSIVSCAFTGAFALSCLHASQNKATVRPSP